MRYEGNNRWQFQPWWVKLYRWVKFILPWYPRAWFYYVLTRLGVWKPTTEHEKEVFISQRLYAKHVYIVLMADVRHKAGHWYTMEEMIERINSRQQR